MISSVLIILIVIARRQVFKIIMNFSSMSAPTLTISEQKSAISAKKKKKKTIKNVLDVPRNLKVESFFVEENEAKKLRQILERLLSSARLPAQQNVKSNENLNKQFKDESNLIADARNKRNQLSLGTNSVNRNIKKELISSVLFACDIQPKFLIHHLNLLCNHYKIPFLYMPDLREITRNHLGFPCIALGFKKNFNDFSEAVEEIQSIWQTKKFVSSDVNLECATENSDSNEEEVINKSDENLKKSDENPFTYLYRTSIKERVFLTENVCINQIPKEIKTGFLKIENDTEPEFNNYSSHQGISSKFNKLKERRKPLEASEVDYYDNNYEEKEFERPKKKIKKDWVIDKKGKEGRIKYCPANLMRVPSNPYRMKKINKIK